MSIAVTSDDLPISAVDEYAETYLAPKISRIRGVGLVDFTSRRRSVRQRNQLVERHPPRRELEAPAVAAEDSHPRQPSHPALRSPSTK